MVGGRESLEACEGRFAIGVLEFRKRGNIEVFNVCWQWYQLWDPVSSSVRDARL